MHYTVLILLVLSAVLLKTGLFAEGPSIRIISVVPDIAKVAKCDGRGFGTTPRNICFNKLSGTNLATLTGSLVNPMDEYGTIAAAMLLGLYLNFVGLNSIAALFWSAVINGGVAVPMMRTLASWENSLLLLGSISMAGLLLMTLRR